MTTAIEHEEYVRSRWEHWHRCDGSYRDYPKGRILLQDVRNHWFDFPDWERAYAFTLEREEQIREVREEMALLRGMIALLQSEPGDETAPIYQRTINRLQEIVAELRKGMK